MLKYFNVSPNVSYNEVYYGKTLDYFLDTTTIETAEALDEDGNPFIDTTSFATITDLLNPGVASFRNFNAGVSVSTQLFGKVEFGRGVFGLKGVRHVLKPTASLSYQPDNRDAVDFISGLPYFVAQSAVDPRTGRSHKICQSVCRPAVWSAYSYGGQPGYQLQPKQSLRGQGL